MGDTADAAPSTLCLLRNPSRFHSGERVSFSSSLTLGPRALEQQPGPTRVTVSRRMTLRAGMPSAKDRPLASCNRRRETQEKLGPSLLGTGQFSSGTAGERLNFVSCPDFGGVPRRSCKLRIRDYLKPSGDAVRSLGRKRSLRFPSSWRQLHLKHFFCTYSRKETLRKR